MSVDDYPNGTTGEVFLNSPLSGVFNHCPPEGGDGSELTFDSDGFFFRGESNKLYEIIITVDGGRIRNFYDPFSNSELEHSSVQLLEHNNTATSRMIVSTRPGTSSSSPTVYFNIDNVGLGERDQNYTINVTEHEVPIGTSTLVHLFENKVRHGLIDSGADRDSYLVKLEKDFTYRFDMRGDSTNNGSLTDPSLSLYNGNYIPLRFDDNGGVGQDASFAYVAPVSGYYYVEASANQVAGSYELEFEVIDFPDDAPAHPGTNSRLELIPNSYSSLTGTIEIQGDLDWHQVDLIAGRWYEISFAGGMPAQLFDTNYQRIDRALPSSSPVKPNYFRATQTGTHFIEVGSRSPFSQLTGGYSILVGDNSVAQAFGHSSIDLVGNATRSLSTIFYPNDFPAERLQLVSEADFFIGDSIYDRYLLHNIPIDQIADVRFEGGLQRGDYDVSVRAVGGGTTTPWIQTVVSSTIDPTAVLGINQKWDSSNTELQTDDVVTYRFADSVPSYFADDRFAGFAAVSDQVRQAFEGILGFTTINGERGLSSLLDVNFELSDSETADIQIFTADATDRAIGYFPGKAGFGDIVLDNDLFSGAATAEPGGEEYFDILKSVASAIGMKHFTTDFDRQESIVGLKYSDTTGQPFPESYGTQDIQFLGSLYGIAPNRQLTGNTDSLGSTDETFVRTIFEESNASAISAESSPRAASIDLRPGAISHLLGGGPWQSYAVGESVYVNRALGSQFNDQLTGSHFTNRIEGYGGDDVIAGLSGDDQLLGGLGNDTYLYETGDGNDWILEEGTNRAEGGIDTIQIKGKFGLDRLEDDLSFRRNGDHLLIDLNMNGEDNRSSGQIDVRYMSYEPWQVERLDLRNFSTELGVISLVSIWEGATEQSQRFALTGTSDAFGLVAAPV